jgi:hypothetical protein
VVATTREFHRDAGGDVTPFVAEWVTPLQPEGMGRPVFVFPPAHDERSALAIEAKIAVHVGRDRPFWGFGGFSALREVLRSGGPEALGAEYVAQIRAIQPEGSYLLYGNCLGGYLAWETARQLLAAGEEIAGILFFEVPLRSDFARVRSGRPPVDHPNPWRLAHHYRVRPLPVDLTHVMTAGWHASKWWRPWQEVALGSFETVIIPGETETAFDRREERIARHVRDWIERSEARLEGAPVPR